jgi:hypothetical protein
MSAGTVEESRAPAMEEEPPLSVGATTVATLLPLSMTMTATTPTATTNNKIQFHLVEALTDMAIRSDVRTCLDEMLLDVETTFYLNQTFQGAAAQMALEQSFQHHQATILECTAERQSRDHIQEQLADQLVVEIMSLSKELEELLKWKRDHVEKVEEYDTLVQTLARTQQELVETRRNQKQQQAANNDATAGSSMSAAVVENDHGMEHSKTSNKSLKEESTGDVELPATGKKPAAAKSPITPVASTDDDDKDTKTTKEETAISPAVSFDRDIPEEEAKPSAVPSTAASAVVMLDEDEEQEKSTTLVDLDVEILMTIFGFIDAMDILNMAQINIAMYSKIDNIFGISEDGQSPPQPTPPPAPAPAPVRQPPQPPPTTQTARPAATIAQMTTATTPPRPSSTSASSTSAVATAASGPIGNRLFSILQPAKVTAPVPGKKMSSSSSLTPLAVQSMAAKLNDTEVAAILSMTDKLHRMDKEVVVLRQEKDAIAAQLQGTEAVKQYLIAKVRDIEHRLVKSQDDEVKVAQQIASDQEVIAFLDTRVRELERQTEMLTKEKTKSQSELSTLKVQTSKKITVLSDMLKYEREKLKDEEGEWKATKKVLVKEVKSCRAQILALQAERDGLREHNEMLKRAIVTTNSSSSSGGTGKNSMNRPRGESSASGGSIK